MAGIRTPERIEETLAKAMPAAHKQLVEIGKKLEAHYRDVQDVEFTVQRGKVWMLQTRNAKRTGFAAVRIAVDMVNEGLIGQTDALSAKRIPADDLNQLLQPIYESRIEARSRPGRPAAGQGDQRRAGRRLGQDLLPRFRRRAGMAQGQQGQADPGAPRNQPRRPARHEDRPGHSDRLRRRQLARGPGQPADGQGLHRRLRRSEHRLCRRHRDRQRQGAQGRRHDLDRRLYRRSLRGTGRNAAQRDPASA